MIHTQTIIKKGIKGLTGLLLITLFQAYPMNDQKILLNLKPIITEDSNPLHFCILTGKINKLRQLLQNEENPNTPTKEGKSPLQLAIEKNNFEMVKALVLAGASLKKIIRYDNNDITPETFAQLLQKTTSKFDKQIVIYLQLIGRVNKLSGSTEDFNEFLEFLNKYEKTKKIHYSNFMFEYLLHTGACTRLKDYFF